MKLTVQQTLQAIKAIPSMTARRTQYGEYCVNVRGLGEDTAYYTEDAEDAIDTARAMAKHELDEEGF